MKIVMPSKVTQIIHTLQNAGYEAYAVGGCVRDSLLGREPDDWDITTNAYPEQIKGLFRRTVDTGIKHGTVTVMLGKEGFEITTYRIDGVYEDSRHPKEVTFTASLAEDLKRRDFTINAMAYNDEAGIVDLFDGLSDINAKVIRAVGDPKERFTEDALRILRALRFSAQLDYSIDAETRKAIAELKDNLRQISKERIREELKKLLLSDHPDKLREMKELGITDVVLPEYNTADQELIASLLRSEKNLYVRLSVLLYYLGDPEGILRGLKYDNETIKTVSTLVAHADDETDLSPEAVRRDIVRIGFKRMPLLFLVKRALSQNGEYIDNYETVFEKILSDADCISLKDLKVTGDDLMQEFHLSPGKEIGEKLQFLFDRVLEDPSLNEREILLKLLHQEMEDHT